jgi:protein-S-isoprenylcysteine O-methyltransferase Ste14
MGKRKVKFNRANQMVMWKKLLLKVLIFYPVFVCFFFFLPAGSFKFWEAWIYAVVLFIPMMTTLFYLAKNDPELLERRMRTKEKEEKQRIIIRLFRLPFILGFFIPGFDYRFDWSDVPMVLVIIANAMVFIGYFLVFFVFKENSYTSRIVEVEKEQKVISTGPYSVVRHPMYSGMMIMFLFTPLALGSWWALAVYIFLPLVFVLRIFNEEELLLKDLPGYKEYCQKTRYRLIPFIW